MNSNLSYGTQVAKSWYFNDNWLKEVEPYCYENENKYELQICSKSNF
jgi:hypothetical protein